MLRLLTAYHELAHHFLHAPKSTASVNFFHLREDPKVRLGRCFRGHRIAMIPEPLLQRMLTWEIEDGYGYTREMLDFRLKVLDVYGI